MGGWEVNNAVPEIRPRYAPYILLGSPYGWLFNWFSLIYAFNTLNAPVSPAFSCYVPTNFDQVVFHFHAAQSSFQFHTLSSLTHVFVCKCVALSPCILSLSNYLPFIELEFNSPVVWEQTLYDSNAIKFVEACFMAPSVVHVGECSSEYQRKVDSAIAG